MNETSTAPASSASVARPEFGNSTYSRGRLIACPSAAAMSAVTPCGLPSPSFTTKKIDFSGANTSATRSLPVGASSFTSSSQAAALCTSGRVNTTAIRIFEASLLEHDLAKCAAVFGKDHAQTSGGRDGLHRTPPLLIGGPV